MNEIQWDEVRFLFSQLPSARAQETQTVVGMISVRESEQRILSMLGNITVHYRSKRI